MSKKNKNKDINQKRKPPHKGKKALRGEPLVYDEVKVKLNLSITPTAKSRLKLKAEQQQCSISSLIEELARSSLIDDFNVDIKLKDIEE